MTKYCTFTVALIQQFKTMARIDLADPYEEYLRKQVDAGLFRSITAAAEHAIAQQMKDEEERRVRHIHALISKGEKDIQAGRTISYTHTLMDDIAQKGKEAFLSGKKPKYEIRGKL